MKSDTVSTLKPNVSLSSFTFIKRLFNSSSLSAIRVLSSLVFKKCHTFIIPYNNSGNFLKAAKTQSRNLYTHTKVIKKVSGLRTEQSNCFA